jgi:tRNA(fMet)-specific endonuclease VapC
MVLSVVVLFEILSGADDAQRGFWKGFFRGAVRLPFDERVAETAADISRKLRHMNIRLESCDVFIAATAIVHGLPVATLNHKHFEPIEGVELV